MTGKFNTSIGSVKDDEKKNTNNIFILGFKLGVTIKLIFPSLTQLENW